MRPKLSYANVMSTLCLFLLLGGGAYAAGHLGKNSVGTRQLRKNAVTATKIKKNAVTGAKIKNKTITAAKVKSGSLTGTQINASTLGTVPSANTANSLSPPENWHEVGAPGEPAFMNGWHNFAESFTPAAAFYKDHEGIVHLRGGVTGGTSSAFLLPDGYRPASGTTISVAVLCGECLSAGVAGLAIVGPGVSSGLDGAVVPPQKSASLDGVSFRAES